ncbi:MAG: helix-turn-helix transcriptional regulator [Candidatus Cybelea sp.]
MQLFRLFIDVLVYRFLARCASESPGHPIHEGLAVSGEEHCPAVRALERSGLSGFGALLRRHRLAAGLSQQALAERARMSANGIGALERGYRRKPQHQTFALLVYALELEGEEYAKFESAARSVGRAG